MGRGYSSGTLQETRGRLAPDLPRDLLGAPGSIDEHGVRESRHRMDSKSRGRSSRQSRSGGTGEIRDPDRKGNETRSPGASKTSGERPNELGQPPAHDGRDREPVRAGPTRQLEHGV